MEGSEHAHRPCKRIRLTHTFEYEVTSFSSPQVNQGHDHGAYTQALPRLNLEEARTINPFVSTCETHRHQTFDYLFAQCTGLNDQSPTTSTSIISPSPSVLPAAVGPQPECNNGLSTGVSPDQVCFGMVGLLLLKQGPRYSTCKL